MAWNNNFPNPPPYQGPPGPPGYTGPAGPPQGFWDFIQSFDPNTNHGAAPGFGVDHTGPQPGFPGFPFGPEGFGPWAAGGRGRGGWPFGPGGPGRHHSGGRHHEHGHSHSRSHGRHGHGHGRRGRHGSDDDGTGSGGDEDLHDITTAAAVAEAEMMAEKEKDSEKTAAAGAESPNATMRDATDEAGEHPDPPEEVPCAEFWGRRGRGRGGCGRGRRGGPFFGPRGRGGHGHGHSHHGPPPSGPLGGPGGPFDFNGMMSAFAHHPYAQRVREYVERARAQAQGAARNNGGDEQTFTPPVDVFNTHNGWTLHIAVPGAKKEDIGVHWDADRSTLTVSGVVHRPGDEEFLSGMLSGERRVGLFERKIQLPPAEANENKDEVDGDHISAKMEDGVLIVVVPKVEKEWTEVKKVDIE